MDVVSFIGGLIVGVPVGMVLMHAFAGSIKREVSMLHDRVSQLETKPVVVHTVSGPPAS